MTERANPNVMPAAARAALYSEAGNWLSRGRSTLLRHLVSRLAVHTGDVLEIGCGAGEQLKTLAAFGAVDAIEIDDDACRVAEGLEITRTIYRTPIPQLALDRRYDLICALDVLEYLPDDKAALEWIGDHLKPGGIFICFLPAYQWLMGPHDLAVGNLRRYDKAKLKSKVPAGMEIVEQGYFVSFLFVLALVTRGLAKAAALFHGKNAPQAKQSSKVPSLIDRLLYQTLCLEAKLIDRGFAPPFGLTLFAVFHLTPGRH